MNKSRNSKSKQVKIAKYYIDNKSETSYKKVAIRFKATPDQVRRWVEKYERNEYAEARSEAENNEVEAEKVKIRQELKDTALTALLDEVIIDVLSELRMRGDMTTEEKMNAINKMTMAMQRTQKLQFVEALKKPDAQKVIKLCKMIDSSLTEKEIIDLWQQIELEK